MAMSERRMSFHQAPLFSWMSNAKKFVKENNLTLLKNNSFFFSLSWNKSRRFLIDQICWKTTTTTRSHSRRREGECWWQCCWFSSVWRRVGQFDVFIVKNRSIGPGRMSVGKNWTREWSTTWKCPITMNRRMNCVVWRSISTINPIEVRSVSAILFNGQNWIEKNWD